MPRGTGSVGHFFFEANSCGNVGELNKNKNNGVAFDRYPKLISITIAFPQRDDSNGCGSLQRLFRLKTVAVTPLGDNTFELGTVEAGVPDEI